jgi:hypothetical protein
MSNVIAFPFDRIKFRTAKVNGGVVVPFCRPAAAVRLERECDLFAEWMQVPEIYRNMETEAWQMANIKTDIVIGAAYWPSLAFGFNLSVGGRDRNDIKEYIGEAFDGVLRCEVKEGWQMDTEGDVSICHYFPSMVREAIADARVTLGQKEDWQMAYRITTQKELRREFWDMFPDLPNQRTVNYGGNRKHYPTDTRVAFCDWIDALSKSGDISQALAERATLD